MNAFDVIEAILLALIFIGIAAFVAAGVGALLGAWMARNDCDFYPEDDDHE